MDIGCFQFVFFNIMNSVTMNVYKYLFEQLFSILWYKYLRVELTNHMIILRLTFFYKAFLFYFILKYGCFTILC